MAATVSNNPAGIRGLAEAYACAEALQLHASAQRMRSTTPPQTRARAALVGREHQVRNCSATNRSSSDPSASKSSVSAFRGPG